MRAPSLIATALVAFVAALPASAATPTARYAARVNAACDAYQADLRALPRPRTSAQYASYISAALRSATTWEIGAVAALTPPAGLAESQRQAVAAGRALTARMRVLLPRLRSGALSITQFEHDSQLLADVQSQEAAFGHIGARECAG